MLRAIVRHVIQPLWNYVSPADQNGPMALMDLIFTWGDSGISHAFISDMVLKVHTEYQRNFENWLDGAVKEPPKLAEIPMHLQHRLQEETATVKQVNEIQRRFSAEGPRRARPRVGGAQDHEERDAKRKKKKKKRGRDDSDKAPVKPSAPISRKSVWKRRGARLATWLRDLGTSLASSTPGPLAGNRPPLRPRPTPGIDMCLLPELDVLLYPD